MNPERLDLGFDDCTECGGWSCRRLPERYPHVCSDCLFPRRGKDRGDDKGLGPLAYTDLLAMLHATVASQSIDFFKPYAHNRKQEFRGDL